MALDDGSSVVAVVALKLCCAVLVVVVLVVVVLLCCVCRAPGGDLRSEPSHRPGVSDRHNAIAGDRRRESSIGGNHEI